MKRSLPLCALLLSSFILSGCNDAQIAEYAKQNDIILTPEVVNSLQGNQNPNINTGIGNGVNNNPVVNPNVGNKPNTHTNNTLNPNNSVPVIRIGQGKNAVTVPLETATQILKGDAGPQGPQGPAGPQGEKGDSGDDGKDGKDGRGIESLEINDEGHLIAHYTDGESQDVGSVRDNTSSTQRDYEEEGYKLPISDYEAEGHMDSYGIEGVYDYSISNLVVELKDINSDNPINKYHYNVRCKINISNFDPSSMSGLPSQRNWLQMTLDYSRRIAVFKFDNLENREYDVSYDFYSSIPYSVVTSLFLSA